MTSTSNSLSVGCSLTNKLFTCHLVLSLAELSKFLQRKPRRQGRTVQPDGLATRLVEASVMRAVNSRQRGTRWLNSGD
jgi:hypothetical protein